MTYEIAKKLKDAGFPQHERRGIGHGDEFLRGSDGELAYAPTLEELIEACGENFSSLNYGADEWEASAVHADEETIWSKGSTPSEAVANLWLALNNK